MAVSITDELSSMLKNSEFPLYERAVMFAAAAHSGMTRKGSQNSLSVSSSGSRSNCGGDDG